MDEEYDVIVLGTGLTVSAASGVRGSASPSPPRDAAALGPILPSLPSRRCRPRRSCPRKDSPMPIPPRRCFYPLPWPISKKRPLFWPPPPTPRAPTPGPSRPPYSGRQGRKTHPRSPRCLLLLPDPAHPAPTQGQPSITYHLALILVGM